MMKFVLGVVLGFFFSREIENPRLLLECIDIRRRHVNDTIVVQNRKLSDRIADAVYTIIG